MNSLVPKLLLFLAVNSALLNAQTVPDSLHVETPGSLSTLVTETDKLYITDLEITGSINGDDFLTIREMLYLANLNLKEATIVAGGNTFTLDNSLYYGQLSGLPNLETVVLPDNLILIGQSSFYDCAWLKEVVIGNQVTEIAMGAFADCKALTTLELPMSLKTIGNKGAYTSLNGTFEGCTKLTTLTIPRSVTSVDVRCFKGCTKLQTVVLPDMLTSIPSEFFSGCTALTSITLPSRTTTIGFSAFNYCASLETIDLPDAVEGIDGMAFASCSKLTTVSGGEGLLSITDRAFWLCSSLNNISFNAGLLSIGESAFEGCVALPHIILPNSVAMISESAFKGCTALETVIIEDDGVYNAPDGTSGGDTRAAQVPVPGQLTRLPTSLFEGCTNLRSVMLPASIGSIGMLAFKDCVSLQGIDLPEALETIDIYAFSGCSALESIVFPEKVRSIGQGAFGGCSALRSVRCLSATPPTLGGYVNEVSFAFWGVDYEKCWLHIPVGTTDTYRAHHAWSKFIHTSESLVDELDMPSTGLFTTVSRAGEVWIRGGEPGAVVRVYDSRGALVRQLIADGAESRLDRLAPGVYIVTCGREKSKLIL